MHATIESGFRVEWRPLATLCSIAPQWRALAARALEPNAFYEPAFAIAAAPVFGRHTGAGLVWSRTTPGRLLGLFPATSSRLRYGWPMPVLVGWTHPCGPFGAPLIDGEVGETVIDAWLDHLARDARRPKLMLMPYFPVEGPLARALDAALARSGGRSILFDRHVRAQLAPGNDRSRYIEGALDPKKLKELRRQLRRLDDKGMVSWRMASEPDPLAEALENFLRLEASGWKGRAGTAARQNPKIRPFIEMAVAQLAREGKARIAELLLDGRAVASLLLLQSKDTIWTWKIAYDEAIARASPGVQLILHVTRMLLDDPAVGRADSCAAPDHPMINRIWRERLPLADRLICIGNGGSAVFMLAAACEAVRRSMAATGKNVWALSRR